MLDVLMSVHQEWIAKMVSGEKTGELRKTWPKNIQTPFRVRLYCTRGRGPQTLLLDGRGGAALGDYRNIEGGAVIGNGYVVGEFICPGRTIVTVLTNADMVNAQMVEVSRTTCLSFDEIAEYIGRGNTGSAWHIRDLKIYDKPMELSRFFMPAERDGGWMDRVERAPQSWCYIKSIVRGVG